MPAIAAWTPGPHHPRLAGGAVHVWRADLEAVADDVGELLCEQERERAARLLREQDRRRFTRARGLLRTLLGRYMQTDPRALRFEDGPHGKPALLESDSPSFNVSHSEHLALYAFSAAGAVGVDVEVAAGRRNEVALAARVFGPQEASRLEGLDPATRTAEFLRAWVRHEAALKCRGTGIGAGGLVRRER
jgi:4'-phosphopantetheinyl transferase